MWATIKAIAMAITSLKALAAMVTSALGWYAAWKLKKQAQARNDEITKADEELRKANEVQDDEARLKAKAAAICKIEKTMDPNADCDLPADH